MRIDTHKSRISGEETPRERELRGRLEKAEREIEGLKKRVPLPATPEVPKK